MSEPWVQAQISGRLRETVTVSEGCVIVSVMVR